MSYRNYKKNFEEELVLAETRITLDDKHYDNVKRDYNFEDINCLDTDKINVFLDK